VINTVNSGTWDAGITNSTSPYAGINSDTYSYVGINSSTWPYAGINSSTWPYAGTSTSTYISGGGTTAAITNLYGNTTRQLTPLESFEYLAPTATRLEETKSAQHSIEEFGKLNENWDGYGASSISTQARDNATRFITIFDAAPFTMPLPDVFPQPSGTISFEWETPSAEVYLEIGNTLYSGFIKTDDDQTFFLQGQADSLDQQIVALMHGAIAGPSAYSAPTITEIRTQPQRYEQLAA
jgi:hypothetical protein